MRGRWPGSAGRREGRFRGVWEGGHEARVVMRRKVSLSGGR